MLYCSIPSCIEAKCTHNCRKNYRKPVYNGRFTFEFGNSLDFERLVLHFDASTARN